MQSSNDARGGGEERRRDTESWREGGGEWAVCGGTTPTNRGPSDRYISRIFGAGVGRTERAEQLEESATGEDGGMEAVPSLLGPVLSSEPDQSASAWRVHVLRLGMRPEQSNAGLPEPAGRGAASS